MEGIYYNYLGFFYNIFYYYFFFVFRIMVMDKGLIVEFDFLQKFLDDKFGVFYFMVKDVNLVS